MKRQPREVEKSLQVIYLTWNVYLEYIRTLQTENGKYAKDLNKCISKEDIQIVSSYMKRFSAPLTAKEMKIKTTGTHHHTPTRMAILTSGGEDMEKLEPLHTASRKVSDVLTLENSLAVPQLVKRRVTIYPAMSIPAIRPREVKICPCRNLLYSNLLTNLFTAVLLVIAKK